MWRRGGGGGGGGGRMSHDVPAGAVVQVKRTFPPGRNEEGTKLLLMSEMKRASISTAGFSDAPPPPKVPIRGFVRCLFISHLPQ